MYAFLEWYRKPSSEHDNPEIYLLNAVAKSSVTIIGVAALLKALELILTLLGIHGTLLPFVGVPLVPGLISLSDLAIFVTYGLMLISDVIEFVVLLGRKLFRKR